MNNRFKFRVWDRILKRYLNNPDDWSFLLTPTGHVCEWDGGCWSNGDWHNYKDNDDEYQRVTYVIQQYTGLKDNADREIYEGDIVSYKGYTGQVSFLAGMFLIDYPDQTDSGPIGFLQTVDIEVIGNIFENKELLN